MEITNDQAKMMIDIINELDVYKMDVCHTLNDEYQKLLDFLKKEMNL